MPSLPATLFSNHASLLSLFIPERAWTSLISRKFQSPPTSGPWKMRLPLPELLVSLSISIFWFFSFYSHCTENNLCLWVKKTIRQMFGHTYHKQVASLNFLLLLLGHYLKAVSFLKFRAAAGQPSRLSQSRPQSPSTGWALCMNPGPERHRRRLRAGCWRSDEVGLMQNLTLPSPFVSLPVAPLRSPALLKSALCPLLFSFLTLLVL